jgi:diguanylate cyclase (GGDEF)-like protein
MGIMSIQRRIFGNTRGQPGPFLAMVLAYAAFAGLITALSDVTLLDMAGAGWSGYVALAKGTLVALVTGSILLLALRRNTSEQAKMKEELYLAQHDPSTTLLGRAEWIRRVDTMLGGEQGSREPAVVLSLTLDRYDYLVHRFGAEQLNQCLGVFGRYLRMLGRGEDIVGRASTAVFLIYMDGVGSREQAMLRVESILEGSKRNFMVQGEPLSLDLNIGLCAYPDDGAHAEDLMARASIAMQGAAVEGVNRCCWYKPEVAQKVIDRVSLEKDLARALVRDELQLYFQPRVALDTETISGCEALLRWRHPVRGLVPPAAFIKVAEDSGLINEIGRWVLAHSVAFLRQWAEAGLPPMHLSVNVSNTQLEQDDFIRHVDAALGVDRAYVEFLELELTESQAMQNPERTMAMLHRIKQAGLRVALDDFGTGYSSLSYLQRFPIDCLKVDRSFIVELTENRNSQELIKTVIALGHTLGATVIAEGVETRAQTEMLARFGCDEAQGYFYGRPAPGDQLIAQMRGARTALRHGNAIPLLQPVPAVGIAAVRGAVHAGA